MYVQYHCAMTFTTLLSPLDTRVLGVLIEKQHAVPDSYPLTLNYLLSGCNQKTSRDPVMEVSEADLMASVETLKRFSLLMESSGGRVMRYAHNAERVLQLPTQAVALLATLALRGAQTAGELRINSDRLHKFADISAVEGFLQELASRVPQLAIELPRQPGSRENRWAHCLSGVPDVTASSPTATPTVFGAEAISAGEVAVLRKELADLQAEVVVLKATVAALCRELGVTPKG